MLEYKVATPVPDAADQPLEPDEAGRAVVAISHQILQRPLAFNISFVHLCHAGPSQLGGSRQFAKGFSSQFLISNVARASFSIVFPPFA